MYLGHVMITTCVQEGLKNVRLKLAYLPFLFGALFPDIVDKTFALLIDLPGRYVCHSVVVLTILSLVATIALPKKRELTYAFVAGTMLHLIQDIPIEPNNLLWPLFGPLEHKHSADFIVRLCRFYVEIDKPIPWAIEMVSLPWFIMIVSNYVKRTAWVLSGNSKVTSR